MTDARQEAPRPDHVPLFGSWRRIYASVIVVTLLVMGALALFSSWNF